MSRKVKATDKVVTKYSRDGLTEQKLADKSERLVSDKKSDFELRRSDGSEEHIRYLETRITGRKQKPVAVRNSTPDNTVVSNFNIVTEEKAAPYNVLADIPKNTVNSHTSHNQRKITCQDTQDKRDIKRQNKTEQAAQDKIIRYTYSDKPKKEYIRQEPKANNFKKRQRKAVVSEHQKKESGLHTGQDSLKFTEDKGLLKFSDQGQKLHTDKIADRGLQFEDTDEESTIAGETVRSTQTAAFHTARAVARNTRGTLKRKQQRLAFEKSQKLQPYDIHKITDHLSDRLHTSDSSGADSSAPKYDADDEIQRNKLVEAEAVREPVAENNRRDKLEFESIAVNTAETALVPIGETAAVPAVPRIGEQTKEKTAEKSRAYLRAERKAEKAEKKLKRAERRQPTRKVLKAERVYDDTTGRARIKLHFEDEKKPPSNPHFIVEAPKQIIAAGASAVVGKAHQKLYQAEHENSAVKAAHRTELLAEGGLNKTVRYAVNRYRAKPYRLQKKVDRLKYKADKANSRLMYEKMMHENPDLQKILNKKTRQKNFMKKKHQKEMRKQAQKKTAKKAAEKTARVLKELVTVKNKGCAVAALTGIILAVVFCSLFAFVLTSMTGGFVNEYVSSNEEVGNVAAAWNSMEEDIQNRIDNAEHDYPDYDRYVYIVESTRADKKKVLAYLSAKHHSIVYADCRTEIQDLFNLVYEFSYEEYIDGDYKELDIKLHVNSLDDIIDSNLTTDEERQAYGAYLEIFQNSEDYNNIING